MAQSARAQTDEQGANWESVQSASAPSIVQFQEVNSIAKSLALSRFRIRFGQTDGQVGRRRRPQTKMMPVPVAAVLRVAELPSRAPSSPTDRARPIDRGGRRGPFAFYSMKVLEQNLVRFHDHDEKGQQSRPASHATFATV